MTNDTDLDVYSLIKEVENTIYIRADDQGFFYHLYGDPAYIAAAIAELMTEDSGFRTVMKDVLDNFEL